MVGCAHASSCRLNLDRRSPDLATKTRGSACEKESTRSPAAAPFAALCGPDGSSVLQRRGHCRLSCKGEQAELPKARGGSLALISGTGGPHQPLRIIITISDKKGLVEISAAEL